MAIYGVEGVGYLSGALKRGEGIRIFGWQFKKEGVRIFEWQFKKGGEDMRIFVWQSEGEEGVGYLSGNLIGEWGYDGIWVAIKREEWRGYLNGDLNVGEGDMGIFRYALFPEKGKSYFHVVIKRLYNMNYFFVFVVRSIAGLWYCELRCKE